MSSLKQFLLTVVNWILNLRSSVPVLSLPTRGEFYLQELHLRQLALLEAVKLRPPLPLQRPEDPLILEEYRQLENNYPLEFNSEQMYQDLLAEREVAAVLEAQATMGEWWGIASEFERQQWLTKARAVQQQVNEQ